VGVVSEDAKLGNGINWRLQNEATIDAVEIVGAVDEEIVGLGALAVDGVGLTGAERAAGFGEAGGEGNDAGLEQAKLREVAAIERKIEEFAFGDDSAETRGGGI